MASRCAASACSAAVRAASAARCAAEPLGVGGLAGPAQRAELLGRRRERLGRGAGVGRGALRLGRDALDDLPPAVQPAVRPGACRPRRPPSAARAPLRPPIRPSAAAAAVWPGPAAAPPSAVHARSCAGTKAPGAVSAHRRRRSASAERAASAAAACPAASFACASSRSRAAVARASAAAASPAASSAADSASAMAARSPAANATAAACRARSAGRARSCSASTTRRSRCASAVANWWASTGSTACHGVHPRLRGVVRVRRGGLRPLGLGERQLGDQPPQLRRDLPQPPLVLRRNGFRRSRATSSSATAAARRSSSSAFRATIAAASAAAARCADASAARRRPRPAPRACSGSSRSSVPSTKSRSVGEVGPLGDLLRVTRHEVGERLRLLGVEHRAQQEVDERLVAAERERLRRLALLGVHRALVAEQLGVEPDVDEVARPLAVRGLPHQLGRRGLACAAAVQPVLERRHRHAAAVVGERQVVEAEPGPGPERVPGVGEPGRVRGHDVAGPLGHLAGDEQRPGGGVHPLARDVRDVLAEHELRQHVGARRAHHLAAARQQHREHQLQQHGLAAAVLEEQHRRGCRSARHAVECRRARTGRPGGPRRAPASPMPRRSRHTSW